MCAMRESCVPCGTAARCRRGLRSARLGPQESSDLDLSSSDLHLSSPPQQSRDFDLSSTQLDLSSSTQLDLSSTPQMATRSALCALPSSRLQEVLTHAPKLASSAGVGFLAAMYGRTT